MNKQYLSILISFLISLTMQAYIPIYDIKGNISSLNITIKEENYFESVINDTIHVMKNYAFINILKSPPKVNGHDYFKKVDIIQQLENLKTTINKETKFYQFYQEISKIIYSAKDYHIIFTYIKQEKPFDLLTKLSICSPIEFIFKKDKSVLGKINNLVLALGGGKVQIENQESINNNYINKIAIKQINGINVYEFIRNFCGDYIQFKSPSAKFVWNRENIKIAQLWQCPLNSEEFHYFNITYSNGVTISSKYIGFLNNNEINELKNFGINNYEVNPTYNNELFNSISEQNAINWDINIDNHIKCKVDNINHVNVIYQNSFKTNSPDHIGIVNNFSYCHGNFSNNDYPLIVIENLNGGGFAQLSKLMQQLVQDLMRPKNYFSIILNEKTREFLRANKDSFIFVDDTEKRNLTINELFENKVAEKFDNITIERSKQRIIVDLNFESLIKNNIFKRNKIKKPTEVIVFTDGLSFSATSVFIKNLYYFGGAILVGYGGDPELDSFDASQNPTFVLTNLTEIDGYKDLIKKGFYFGQLPSGPMYRSRYDKNNNDIPEEFTVNYIDERINLYNAYDDSLYDEFINEAKKIFNKYKTQCNVNNKYMKLLNEECKFDDKHLHGGNTCGSDGKWSKTCEPFYCDEDYYFDSNSKVCISNMETILDVDNIQTFSTNYQNDLLFKLIPDNISNDLRINIHSLDCKIKINVENNKTNFKLNQMNNDTFSFHISSKEIKNTKIRVSPLINGTDGEINASYKYKAYTLIVSNNQIDNKKGTLLKLIDSSNIYFDENLQETQFFYDVMDIDLDEPIALSLSFNQKSKFDININVFGNETFIIKKQISNTTNIFFNNKFKKGDQLVINIKHINSGTSIFMNIKMIKKTSISILEKNNLNLGIISSKIEFQYYYMEVFKDQEGEIILHNKIEKGIIMANLIKKDEIFDLYNTDIFPKNDLHSTLKFNQHSLKLTFNSKDTSKCEKGCYLLMTYHKINYDKENPTIRGYEYTILSRIWNLNELSPQIINIPFNEYILGSFYKESIKYHYYSLFVPNDAEKIVIQLEGNYLDAFMAEGIIKINTTKENENIENLNITHNHNVKEIYTENGKFNFKNKYITIAFRAKYFSDDIFSFYYFRIFYLRKNEILFYPIDSNFGNLCLPVIENGKYYCNLILNNNYNQLSTNFSIVSDNQIDYYKIYYFFYDKNNKEIKKDNVDLKYLYFSDKNNSDINYIYFKFEFYEEGIKNIISAFSDKSPDIFPQIYSAQLFYVNNFNKSCNFSLKHNYIMNYRWISGNNGLIDLNSFNSPNKNIMHFTRNYRGKTFGIQINEKIKNMAFNAINEEFIFYLKLNSKLKSNGIEEVISGETKSEIMKEGKFPLYYYLNLKNQTKINVDITIRINSYDESLLSNNFEIRGYLVDVNVIKKIEKGEVIDFKGLEYFDGTFIEGYNIGLLQINKNNTKEEKYILMSIKNKEKEYFNSNLLIEIIENQYSKNYLIPINQYIIQSFNINQTSGRKVNNYNIDINDKIDNETTLLVEFSPNYRDLNLTFNKSDEIDCISTTGGFQKYRIKIKNIGIVNFNVSNLNNRFDANYIMRYYFIKESEIYNYEFDKTFSREDASSDDGNDYVSISLKFNNIKIKRKNSEIINEKYNITFFIYGFLYKKEDTNKDLLNNSVIDKNRTYLYKAKTSSIYRYNEKFSLNFKSVSLKDKYIYDLQIRVNIYKDNDNVFNEEFLTYNVEIDLTDIKSLKSYMIFIIIGAIVLVLIIVVVVVWLLCRRYKNKGEHLKEKVLATSISEEMGGDENILE